MAGGIGESLPAMPVSSSLGWWNKIPRGLVAAVICLMALAAAQSAVPAKTAQKSFAEGLQGKPLDPFEASAGRVVVLLFVRTDCPISNRYAPLIQKLSEKFNGKANFWLVYPDAAETTAQIRTHLRDFHYSIPALRDTHHELVKRAQATITPETAVFAADGKLVYHGRIDNWYEDFGRSRATATTHELEDGIVAALNGKTMTPAHANAVGCYISDLK